MVGKPGKSGRPRNSRPSDCVASSLVELLKTHPKMGKTVRPYRVALNRVMYYTAASTRIAAMNNICRYLVKINLVEEVPIHEIVECVKQTQLEEQNYGRIKNNSEQSGELSISMDAQVQDPSSPDNRLD